MHPTPLLSPRQSSDIYPSCSSLPTAVARTIFLDRAIPFVHEHYPSVYCAADPLGFRGPPDRPDRPLAHPYPDANVIVNFAFEF